MGSADVKLEAVSLQTPGWLAPGSRSSTCESTITRRAANLGVGDKGVPFLDFAPVARVDPWGSFRCSPGPRVPQRLLRRCRPGRSGTTPAIDGRALRIVGGSARLAVGLFEPEREGHPVPSFPWNRTGLGQATRDPG
jgi:hypothetical protein